MNVPLRKLGLVLAAVAGLASAGAYGQNRELGATGTRIEGIAAIVDDGVVLLSELDSHTAQVMDELRAQQAQQPPDQRTALPSRGEVRSQLLDQLIIQQIKLQRAARLDIKVSDDELNAALSQVADRIGVPFDQLPAALASRGLDYTEYREDQRDAMIVNQLETRDVVRNIVPTKREIDRCLERIASTETEQVDYNVSHILVGLPSSPTSQQVQDAEKRADDIVDRLNAGEDFSQLAVRMSDAQTALDGGALGWRKGSQLPTIFADVVADMKPGDVAGPIRSGSGFNIIRLNDKRGSERVIVDQVHARHILLVPNDLYDDDATRQRLLGIRQQILDGDDFATIARELSEHTQTAGDGGDLGWINPDDFSDLPEFADLLKTLPIGEISEPVHTTLGWHIVEVLERRTFDTTDELKQRQCIQDVRQSRLDEELYNWEQQLLSMAYVEKKL